MIRAVSPPALRARNGRPAPTSPTPTRDEAQAADGDGPALSPLLVSLPQAAAMLGVSLRTLTTLTAAGELGVVRVGKRAVRVAVSELQRFIEDRSTRRGMVVACHADENNGPRKE